MCIRDRGQPGEGQGQFGSPSSKAARGLIAPLVSEDWAGLRLLGDAFERFERDTAAVPFMFRISGKAEGEIALCSMWELSVPRNFVTV